MSAVLYATVPLLSILLLLLVVELFPLILSDSFHTHRISLLRHTEHLPQQHSRVGNLFSFFIPSFFQGRFESDSGGALFRISAPCTAQ